MFSFVVVFVCFSFIISPLEEQHAVVVSFSDIFLLAFLAHFSRLFSLFSFRRTHTPTYSLHTLQPIPRQTEKTKKAQEKVKQTLRKRAQDEAKKVSDDNARLERVRESTESMQAELNRRIKQGDSMRIKPKDPKVMAAEGQKQMREQLKRLKTSVANAVSKRRFLFDQYKVDARKRDARKKALEKIGAAVFDAPQGGKSWKSTAMKDEHRLLNNNEREEMDLYDDEYGDDDDFEDDGETKKH